MYHGPKGPLYYILRKWRREIYFQISVLKISSRLSSCSTSLHQPHLLNFIEDLQTPNFISSDAEQSLGANRLKAGSRGKIWLLSAKKPFLTHFCIICVHPTWTCCNIKWKLVFYSFFLKNTTRWQPYPTSPEKEIRAQLTIQPGALLSKCLWQLG